MLAATHFAGAVAASPLAALFLWAERLFWNWVFINNNASKASTRAASHFLASAASVFVAKATVRVVGLDVWVGNPVGVS